MYDTAYFPRAKKIWHKGKFVNWADSLVHSQSHALHYGNSVFEGIRAYSTSKGPAVFRLPEHVDRFFHSASVLGMEVPHSREDLVRIICDVVKENELDSAYIRPLLFYSYGNLGLIPKASQAELVISAWEWGAYLGESAVKGARVCILPWRRIHHSQYDMRAKLGGLYVLSTIGGIYARNKGYDEAVFLNMEGNIAEGPGENVFIVKDGVLITNDITESILLGISRDSLLKIAEDHGIPTRIEPITKLDFFQADEAFFCGTAVEVTPIIAVTDDSDPAAGGSEHLIGSGRKGPVTNKIAEIYGKVVRGEIPEYRSWLTYI